MSCGDEGGPPEALLNKPIQFDVDGQGHVYVMDSGDVCIKAYDGQGRYLRAIGRPGQGPGEFGGVMAFFSTMTGGKLCVLDFFQRRVMFMTSEGRYLSGFLVTGDYSGVAVDGADRVFLSRREAMEGVDKLTSEMREISFRTSIFRVDPPSEKPVHLTDFLGETWTMEWHGATVGAVGGAFVVLWNISREGKIIGGFSGEYSLGVYGQDGKKEFVFGRRYTPIKDKGYQGKVGQKKAKPVYRAIVMDEADNMWLDLYQDDSASGFLYDVFSPDGTFCKQVVVSLKIGRFRNGRIYSLVRPEDGYPSIRRYRMELGPLPKITSQPR
jgi:hypothetical protein